MRGKLKDRSKVHWNLKLEILKQFGTEVEFAKRLGMSKSQLTHIVVGRYPGWPYRKKIAAILGCSERWLFEQEGSDGKNN